MSKDTKILNLKRMISNNNEKIQKLRAINRLNEELIQKLEIPSEKKVPTKEERVQQSSNDKAKSHGLLDFYRKQLEEEKRNS